MTKPQRTVLDEEGIRQALKRISDSIIKKDSPGLDVVLIGIQHGGVHLANRLSKLLKDSWNIDVPVGCLDISMHRDDLDQRMIPDIKPTIVPFDITGKTVILVDDVIFKGRTVRAAMDALNDLGRPTRIQLAVLIDRGHRELPIHPDFVGKTVDTSLHDNVQVMLKEEGDKEAVIIESDELESQTST
jgi:pyrimidine operon attenuation protein/uracil phosphoribosyltransferase